MDQRQYWEELPSRKKKGPEHPVISTCIRLKIETLAREAPLAGRSILEVGCGNGNFTFQLAKIARVVGVDYSTAMLRLNPADRLVRADAARLPFAEGSFDVVLCHQLLHHVGDVTSVIQEMTRVSAKDLIFIEPNRYNPLLFLFALAVPEERAIVHFSPAWLRRTVRAAGLEIVSAFTFASCPPNRTPLWLEPLIPRLDVRHPLGLNNIVIARKPPA